jgi:hypothetical protein
VSTYFEKPTQWTVSIYVNESLKSTANGFSKAGYWTIDLCDFIQLHKGDEFEIVFNTSCEGQSGVPVCENSKGNTNGTSYISYDGETWTNLFDYSQTSCIKAFTILNKYSISLDAYYDNYNPVNITATVTDQFGNHGSGNVTFNLSGEEYIMELANGSASVMHNFNKGQNNISTTFNDITNKTSIEILKKQTDLYLESVQNGNDILLNISTAEKINATLKIYINDNENTLDLTDGAAEYQIFNLDYGNYVIRALLNDPIYDGENSTNITIKKPAPSLSGNKDITMYYGANKVYSVKAYKDTRVAAVGETVEITVNSHTYFVKTDKNGIATFKINLKPKTYIITARYKGIKVSNKITVKPTLITKNIKAKKGKTIKFKATLLNTKGKALKGKKITIKFKGKKYKIKTNKKGKATLKIRNLKVGKYKIKTTYKKLKNTNKITVKK